MTCNKLINVRCEADFYQKLHDIADRNRTTMSDIIKRLLVERFPELKKELK